MRNRLHSMCPYYAMFPESFAKEQIEQYTQENDIVLDPFSGRGTTLLEALLMNRNALAMDINPVAFCLSGAKAEVPTLEAVLAELRQLESGYLQVPWNHLEREQATLPTFFNRAFHITTLKQLLYLRSTLDWKHDRIHRFITALVLGSLHGELDSKFYFSNQMPRTISTKPQYSLNYWDKHDLWPPERDVFGVVASRAAYRLTEDVPAHDGEVILGDVRTAMKSFADYKGMVRLVITSPPYFNVTRYEEDQWLRLWFLGYSPYPTYNAISRDDRHKGKEKYWTFLSEAWIGIAPLLNRDGTIVCRLGAKRIAQDELKAAVMGSIRAAFPQAQLVKNPAVSRIKSKQTRSFRPGIQGCEYEVDFVFSLH